MYTEEEKLGGKGHFPQRDFKAATLILVKNFLNVC